MSPKKSMCKSLWQFLRRVHVSSQLWKKATKITKDDEIIQEEKVEAPNAATINEWKEVVIDIEKESNASEWMGEAPEGL